MADPQTEDRKQLGITGSPSTISDHTAEQRMPPHMRHAPGLSTCRRRPLGSQTVLLWSNLVLEFTVPGPIYCLGLANFKNTH